MWVLFLRSGEINWSLLHLARHTPPSPHPRTEPTTFSLQGLLHTEHLALLVPSYFSKWCYFHSMLDMCKIINTVQINRGQQIPTNSNQWPQVCLDVWLGFVPQFASVCVLSKWENAKNLLQQRGQSHIREGSMSILRGKNQLDLIYLNTGAHGEAGQDTVDFVFAWSKSAVLDFESCPLRWGEWHGVHRELWLS